MTIKEIHQLRREGHHEQALSCAEAEFTRNANKFTASALFYCLNDLQKAREYDEARTIVERMEALVNDYCEGDEIIHKVLATALKKYLPHYKEIKDADEQAKNGVDMTTEYDRLVNCLNNNEIDSRLYPDFGWLLYNVLRHQSLTDSIRRKRMLHQYLKLNLPKPDKLHSLILDEGIKVEKNTPFDFRIRDFMRLWGMENIREEDWEQYKTDQGYTLPSTVERLIGVYTKEVKDDKIEAPEEFSKLIDKALEKYPTNQNMPYFKAIVLISQGRREEAIEYYKDLLLRFPSKAYLWHHTTRLIEDPDIQVGLLSKALCLNSDEQFLGPLRLTMAELLSEKGELAHAKYELDRIREIYTAKGWNLKEEFRALDSRLVHITPAIDNKTLYTRYATMADDFLYNRFPSLVAVKVSDKMIDDRNKTGRKILIWTLRTESGQISLKKPNRLGLDRKTRNGTVFNVKIHNGKIVWIEPANAIPVVDWIQVSTGKVNLRTDRKDNRYAIIGNAYVGDKLLGRISEGDTIRVMALKQNDGRWSAVALKKIK